jgi:hypothetical protein
MLRLHRFKTMDAISVDYFTRAKNRARDDDAGLLGASSKVTRQLRALFEPLATDHVVSLRSACPHLRVVEWPTTSSRSQLSSDTSSRWLESYPNGIRYHWGGRNLVDWRFGWEAKLFEEHYKPYRARNPELRVSWINKSWECRGCCQDSIRWMMELGDVHDRRRLRRLNAPDKARHFILSSNTVNRYASEQEQDQEQDQDRPMLVRRECLRRIRPRNKDPFYISFCGYRELAFECVSWARTSRAKETPKNRKWYGDVCSEYSAAALRGDGDIS